MCIVAFPTSSPAALDAPAPTVGPEGGVHQVKGMPVHTMSGASTLSWWAFTSSEAHMRHDERSRALLEH